MARYVSQFAFWRAPGILKEEMDRVGITVANCTDPRTPNAYGCPPRNYMTRYLCGHGAPCADPPDEGTFREAARHLFHDYAFVGVLEEARPSLAVLQRMFPGYFPDPLGAYGKVNPTNRNAKRKYASFVTPVRQIRVFLT